MKSQNAIQRIYSLFEHACYELFKNYGHNIQRVYGSGFETSDLPCARIDGGNDDFEILIAVHMPFSTLAQTYPVGGPHTIAEDELEDWVSELSNRLLGKLNAQIALHNCPLKSGLPEFSLGSQNDFYQLSKGTLNQFLFILIFVSIQKKSEWVIVAITLME